MNYSKELIAYLLKAIYEGLITPSRLPKNLYKEVSKYLVSGVETGFKIKYEADLVMLEKLKTNVKLFSAAKTFNFVLNTEHLIFEDKKLLPFKEFRKRAGELFDLHHKTWLQTEYDTAIGEAQTARDWQEFERNKDFQKFLRYVTVHDKNVSEICKAKDGIVRKVDDPIWNTQAPLSHFGCRCYLEALNQGVETNAIRIKELPSPSKLFQNNSGKSGEVFTKEHPYFKEVPEKYKAFAKKNFGL